MRRAAHERLSLLEHGEVVEAFADTLSRVGVELDDRCLEELVWASYGHPYLVQLLGYHLIDRINDRKAAHFRRVSTHDVRSAVNEAVDAYKSRALRPMVSELAPAD